MVDTAVQPVVMTREIVIDGLPVYHQKVDECRDIQIMTHIGPTDVVGDASPGDGEEFSQGIGRAVFQFLSVLKMS